MYLVLVLVSQMASGLFRFIGALGRNMIVANTFGSFALLVLLVLGGFILGRGIFFYEILFTQLFRLTYYWLFVLLKMLFIYFVTEDVKKWWIWGYWVSPLMYAQNALAVNEFLGHQWSQVHS